MCFVKSQCCFVKYIENPDAKKPLILIKYIENPGARQHLTLDFQIFIRYADLK